MNIQGLEHLRTPIQAGLDIIGQLRGWTTGLAVPHFAIDLPGGGGKVTLQNDPVIERRGTETLLRNYRGEAYTYPEPEETELSCPYEEVWRGQTS
jgi:lysine 2,3-aminomutase